MTRTKWTKRNFVQRITRLATRLGDMSAEEIRHRLALRLRSVPLIRRRHFEAYSEASQHYAEQFWQSLQADPVKDISHALAQNFFFGPQDKEQLIAAFQQHAPDEIDHVNTLAKRLRTQGLDVLGQPFVAGDDPVDWQADPKTGRRLWTADLLDEATAISHPEGDVKYVWERNRHQFLPLLGQAYWFTGDRDYAATAVKLIDEWIEQNPVGTGVNWCSHLEVAVRVISWLWTMPYLLSTEELNEKFIERWMKSTAQHYYHLSQNLSKFTDPTNHLIGETAALWLLSHVFKTLPESHANEAAASALLSAELGRQIAPDGVNIEQATSYHRFVLDFYLQVMVLKRNGKKPFSAQDEARIAAMLEFCAALAGPRGIAPMIGDSDDARGMPLLELTGWDFRDSLEAGAAIFSRGDWLASNRGPKSAALWLTGNVSDTGADLLPQERTPLRVTSFPDGGYVFINQRDAAGDSELIFDCGPLGLQPNAAHGHADALSIMLRVDGHLLLADPGTGTYFDSQQIRDKFRKTSCHNTVTIDQLDQTDIFDTFKWVNPMNVQYEEPIIHDALCIVAAEHDGYSRLLQPVHHRRTVIATGAGDWLIIDALTGDHAHDIDRWFNFGPGMDIQREAPDRARITDPKTGLGLNLSFYFDPEADSQHLHCDESGLWSTQYGRWEAAGKIRVTARTTGSTTLLTRIAPTRPGTDNVNDSEYSVMSRSGSQIILARRSSRDSDCADPDELIAINPAGSDVYLANEITTNGRLVYLRFDEHREVISAVLTGPDAALSSTQFNLTCAPGQPAATFRREDLH